MTNSNSNSNNSSGIDKQQLYGEFQRGERWKQNLHRRVAHKSFDIPVDDDMYVDNSKTGMGWKELAIVVLGLASATGFAAWVLKGDPPIIAPPHEPSPPAIQQPPPFDVSDSSYKVQFYDRHGNLIDVPQHQAGQ